MLWNGQCCRTGIYSRKIPLDAIIILQNLKILTLCGKRRCCFIKVGYSKPLPPMIRIPILECELCRLKMLIRKLYPFITLSKAKVLWKNTFLFGYLSVKVFPPVIWYGIEWMLCMSSKKRYHRKRLTHTIYLFSKLEICQKNIRQQCTCKLQNRFWCCNELYFNLVCYVKALFLYLHVIWHLQQK